MDLQDIHFQLGRPGMTGFYLTLDSLQEVVGCACAPDQNGAQAHPCYVAVMRNEKEFRSFPTLSARE
jgi:hypothetical protein